MKARIKPSGRVAEIESLRIKGSNRTYYPQELDILPIEPDWQQVRIDAAINVMRSINDHVTPYNELARLCVAYADALVAELKKGGQQ